MKNSYGIREGDIVLLPTTTHDGKIWNPARVVWLGKATFKAEAIGSVIVTVRFDAEKERWKRAA